MSQTTIYIQDGNDQYTAEEYAAFWGSDSWGDKGRNVGDGALFYNFGSHIQGRDKKYLNDFSGAIKRTIANVRAMKNKTMKEDISGLTQLRKFVISLKKES